MEIFNHILKENVNHKTENCCVAAKTSRIREIRLRLQRLSAERRAVSLAAAFG
jgi:hypothetical protein